MYKKLLIVFVALLLSGQDITAVDMTSFDLERLHEISVSADAAKVITLDDESLLTDFNEDDLAIINSANFDLLETREELIKRLREMPVQKGGSKKTLEKIFRLMESNACLDFYQAWCLALGREEGVDIPGGQYYKYMPQYIKDIIIKKIKKNNDARKQSLNKAVVSSSVLDRGDVVDVLETREELIKRLRDMPVPKHVGKKTLEKIFRLMEEDDFLDCYQAWCVILGKRQGVDFAVGNYYKYMPQYIKDIINKRMNDARERRLAKAAVSPCVLMPNKSKNSY